MLHETTLVWTPGIQSGSVSLIPMHAYHDGTGTTIPKGGGQWPSRMRSNASSSKWRLRSQLRTPSSSTRCAAPECAACIGVERRSRASGSSWVWLCSSSGVGRDNLIFLSVLGFVVMVGSAVTAIYSWQHVGTAPDPGRGRDKAKIPPGPRPADGQGFMDKMEERWRKRRDEGF